MTGTMRTVPVAPLAAMSVSVMLRRSCPGDRAERGGPGRHGLEAPARIRGVLGGRITGGLGNLGPLEPLELRIGIRQVGEEAADAVRAGRLGIDAKRLALLEIGPAAWGGRLGWG